MKKIIKFDGLDAYTILLCKGHYENKNFVVQQRIKLRMLNSLMLGYDYDPNNITIDEFISNRLYNILVKSEQVDLVNLQNRMHTEFAKYWRYNGFEPIHAIINFYCSTISMLNVYGKDENGMDLPKSNNKDLMVKFFESDGSFNNELYNLLKL